MLRQDPQDASLLLLGNANTVYISFDGGVHWGTLALNLPHAEVRDVSIDTRKGEVVAPTHARLRCRRLPGYCAHRKLAAFLTSPPT